MRTTAHSARTTLTLALALGVGIALGGCAAEPTNNGGDTGSSQTAPGTAPSAKPGNDVEPPANQPNEYGFVDKKGEVPDWVAKGFPIYPGSVVYNVTETYGSQILGFSVGTVEEATIYQWMLEQYSQNGWSAYDIDDEPSDFSATHSDGHEAYVNVTQSSFVMTAEQG